MIDSWLADGVEIRRLRWIIWRRASEGAGHCNGLMTLPNWPRPQFLFNFRFRRDRHRYRRRGRPSQRRRRRRPVLLLTSRA